MGLLSAAELHGAAHQRPQVFQVMVERLDGRPVDRRREETRDGRRPGLLGWLHSPSMTHRVGSKGQLVIPKAFRDHMNLHPGTEVDFTIDGERLVLVARPPGHRLAGRFAGSGMADRLLEDRAREPR